MTVDPLLQQINGQTAVVADQPGTLQAVSQRPKNGKAQTNGQEKNEVQLFEVSGLLLLI